MQQSRIIIDLLSHWRLALTHLGFYTVYFVYPHISEKGRSKINFRTTSFSIYLEVELIYIGTP